jgi:sensor histidine kinase YesM
MPVSKALKTLDPGMRRDDDKGINQRFLKYMPVNITINNREVKNPVARFLIALLGLVVVLLIFTLLFFLILPFIWFVVLTILLVISTIFLTAPKLISTYRVILLNREQDHTRS